LRADALVDSADNGFQSPDLPMSRNVPKPANAGRLEFDIWVKATGDGAMDDGLLLLVQQRNLLALGANGAVDIPVRLVQKPHDGGLLVGGVALPVSERMPLDRA
jgi:hypothetical protein